MKKISQQGIAHLGLMLLLVVAAVVAFAGYKVYKNQNPAKTVSNSASSVSQSAQSIKSTADLNGVETQLNSQNIDGDLNPAGFDSDVSSLN